MPRPTLVLNFIGWVLIIISYGADLVAPAPDLGVYIRPGETFCSSEYLKIQGRLSSVGCASLCLQWQCHAFFYEGGTCSLTGLLVAPSIGQKSEDFKKIRYTMSYQNIALNRPTHSSSYISLMGMGQIPDLAVDGDDSIGSYFQSSLLTMQPWWYVDLEETRLVKEVHVMFDGDGSHSNLFNLIEIRVGRERPIDGDFSDWELLAEFSGVMSLSDLNRDYQNFSANTTLCGRYVSIKKISLIPLPYFSLNEVKVFALEEVVSD